MSDNLFDQLQGIRQQAVRIVLQSGTRFANPVYDPSNPQSQAYFTAPTTGTAPIVFEVHAVTANEINDADAIITEMPPAIYQEQTSPTGKGMVQVLVDYDYAEPKYVARRQAQIPLRDAAICIYGCEALAASTPGSSLHEKARTLTEKVPAAILEWLAREIGTLSILTAVGDTEVTSFLARGSTITDGESSKSSKSPSRTKTKKLSSKGSTGATSPTSKGRRRTTGG